MLPDPARVARSAFRAGSLRSLLLRPAGRELLLDCEFADPARAARFAARWSAVATPCGGVAWWVAVPVRQEHTRGTGSGCRVAVAGGVQGLWGVLRAVGAW